MGYSWSIRLVAVWIVLSFAPGCLFLPGRTKLERIRAERPDAPWAETVFRREASDGDEAHEENAENVAADDDGEARSLEDLRETLLFWTTIGADGASRAESVLETDPPDLYARVLQAIESGEPEIKLVAYLYDANGLDRYTLVDWYGADGRLLGTDWVLYDAPGDAVEDPPLTVGWDDLAWWEWPQLIFLDIPIYTLIGAKELAFEIVKSPLSALDAGWLGTAVAARSPLSPVSFERAGRAVWEDWNDGFSAFTWRFRARSRHTPFDLVWDLGSAIPVAGLLFERMWPADVDGVPPTGVSPRHLAVSPGIHAGGDDEQATAAWVRWIVSKRPDLTIHSLPYRYGGVFDTIWSLFGLSRGSAYAAAEELVFERGVRPGEEVLGFGFSGGVERMVGASRALRIAGIPVVSVTGAAGPWTGGVPTRSARVHLSENPFADPVVMTTRLVQGVFFWAPSNVEVRTVAEAEGHETPAFPDGRTRAPAAAYLPGFAEAIDWRLGAR